MEFDFKPVEKNTPLGFTKLKKWMLVKGFTFDYVPDEVSFNLFNPRDLDDFFDQQGIKGFIDWSIMNDAFCFYIIPNHNHRNNRLFPSRAEALTALYLKEFEILEARLEAEGK